MSSSPPPEMRAAGQVSCNLEERPPPSPGGRLWVVDDPIIQITRPGRLQHSERASPIARTVGSMSD